MSNVFTYIEEYLPDVDVKTIGVPALKALQQDLPNSTENFCHIKEGWIEHANINSYYTCLFSHLIRNHGYFIDLYYEMGQYEKTTFIRSFIDMCIRRNEVDIDFVQADFNENLRITRLYNPKAEVIPISADLGISITFISNVNFIKAAKDIRNIYKFCFRIT